MPFALLHYTDPVRELLFVGPFEECRERMKGDQYLIRVLSDLHGLFISAMGNHPIIRIDSYVNQAGSTCYTW